MPATFIISFDCEGKWGVIDHLNDHHKANFTNANLNQAYQKLLNILNLRNIKGTFAFVGAFTLSIEEYFAIQERFADVYINRKSWLLPFRQEVSQGCFEGWLNPKAFQMVARESQHEIAAHGFTHLPLSEALIGKEDFVREISLLKSASGFAERKNMTFVYPRNLVGYTQELKAAGFIGYRDGINSKRLNSKVFQIFQKALNILGEFNITQRAQAHALPDPLVCIPSGVFLNLRHGLRKKIPIDITVKRFAHMLNEAIHNDKVIHLYTHPHNFITGNQMYPLLDRLLALVDRAQRRNEIVSLTQRDYVGRIMGEEEG